MSLEGHAFTANHVLEEGRRLVEKFQARSKQILVGLAFPNTENMRGNFSQVDFELVDQDTRHDLALDRLRRNLFKGQIRSGFVIGRKVVPLLYGKATLNPDRPRDGALVGISGYPFGEPVLVTNSGSMATSWSTDITEMSLPVTPFRFPDIADV